MINRFLNSIKDPTRLSLIVSVFFFAGILASAYVMYTLPHDMMFSQAIDVHNMSLAQGVFMKLFIVTGLTFLIGVAAINISARGKREIIVYREKKKEATDTTGQSTNSEGELESRDTTSFRTTIQKLKGEKEIFQEGLNLICKQVDAGQGALYKVVSSNDKRILQMAAGYAMSIVESNIIRFEFGEGLVGQAAALGKSMYIEDVPTGYINILSGLGSASPNYLFMITLKKAGEVKAVVELAIFTPLKENTRKQLEEMAQVLVEQLN
jgi:hypothetical protein